MAEHFLVAIDLKSLPSSDTGFDLKTISYLGRVHITVTPETHHDASAFLRNHIDHFTTYCDCTAIADLEDVISLLNCGAHKIFVSYKQLETIVEDSLLTGQDLSRLIVSFDHSICEGDPEVGARSIFSRVKTLVPDATIGIQLHDVHDWKLLDAMHQISKTEEIPNRYVALAQITRDQYKNTVKHGHVAIVPAIEFTSDPKQHPRLQPAHLLIISALQSDRPDGLFPTVVTDEHGICLGLVYSNEESIETALHSGCGVYHSRRHGLWIKGQESGNTQELISIALDCDADALQFKVRQKGEGNSKTFQIPFFRH